MAVFVITRVSIAIVAYISEPLIVDAIEPTPYHLRPDNILLDVFGSRWDTGFYQSIADEGYRYQGVQLPSVAFFPLMPLLMRAANVITGDTLVSGIVVANLALLAATIVLYRLVEDEWGPRVASRTIFYFLIFPTAFFGSAIYTESLFLLVAIGALYLARRGYWESAAMLGLAAALTRFMGLIVAPMLLAEWWMQRRQSGPRPRPSWRSLVAPAAVPLGTLIFMAYLYLTFGDPLAFVHGSAAWARQPQSPLATIGELLQRPEGGWLSALSDGRIALNNWIDLLFVLLFFALGLALLKRRRWSEGFYVLLGALIPLSSGLLMSQRRYMWALFPAFILLAIWGEKPWVDRTITVLSLTGLVLFTALFANWYWVG
jgi:hypothetical protein